MKKTIAALVALVSAAVFAGTDDLLITFSTPGTDRYADGSQVNDGETYALVWTPKDGGESRTVLLAPFAKNGRCVPTLFRISENTKSQYEDGVWSVYLLDTRDFANDATGETMTKATLADVNAGKGYNAKAKVVDGIVTAGTFNSLPAAPTVGAGDYDLEAAGVPSPRVTDIQVLADEIVVTVADTRPFVKYTLQAGDESLNFVVPEGVKDSNGKLGSEIKLFAPKKSGAQFFKVSTIK